MNLKLLFSFILIFAIKLNILATSISVGGSIIGIGSSVLRGKDISHLTGGSNNSANWRTGIKYMGAKYNIAFTPVVDAKIFVDFPIHIGLESGIGYSIKNSAIVYRVNTSLINGVYIHKVQLNQLSVPLIVKGQYEIAKKVNIYFGIGPKLNINILPPILTTYKNDELIASDDNPVKIKKGYYNILDLDISLVVGFEVKILKLHYVGLRAGYDVNLIGSFYKKTIDEKNPNIAIIEPAKSYIDALAFSLTYRYKFYY